ncbi:acyloxyacyl hydrolase [Marinicella gelatinilytica]|uniref:acyloxyacyl hydrolase n=1 Tax=Marinicella gelatinilytica TaxID=2996017 RepID=UPI002260ACEA|nr:acyloxyacyl hydrolase [Marinicella gelatinilytica]MCX7545900.1 acyloxyacyl hydrolase [Marinicella gelatinilytica]
MYHRYVGIFALACLIFFNAKTNAQHPFSEHTDRHSMQFYGGQINAFNGSIRNAVYGLEYRFPKFSQWGLVPAIGYLTSDAGAEYSYLDMKYTFSLSEHWGLMISTGIGFFEDGKFLDLGHTIEFKSGLELFYEFNNRQRIGVAAHHYSNSRLSKTNPGTESVTMGYTVAF